MSTAATSIGRSKSSSFAEFCGSAWLPSTLSPGILGSLPMELRMHPVLRQKAPAPKMLRPSEATYLNNGRQGERIYRLNGTPCRPYFTVDAHDSRHSRKTQRSSPVLGMHAAASCDSVFSNAGPARGSPRLMGGRGGGIPGSLLIA